MIGFEDISANPDFEGRATIFIDRYTGLLQGAVERCLQAADLIVDDHQKGLDDLLDQDEAWVEQDLVMTLNLTSSSVGKLLSGTHSEINSFLERGHLTALDMIPDADKRLWDAIGRQVERSALGSEEVDALFASASSPAAASIMKIAYDYPLWLFVQEQAGETGFGPSLRAFMDVASHPIAANAMDVGMDFPLWQHLHNYAINYGPSNFYRTSTEDASDDRVKQAMDAGLDYQAAVAVFKRTSEYDRGVMQSGSIKSALESATDSTRQILEERLGGRYDDEPIERAHGEYNDMADEAARSFRGRLFSFEELMQRILNIRDGRRPEDDFGFGGFDDDFDGANQERIPGQDSQIPSPYDVLGVRQDATEEEIKKSFRGLVRQHHPDAGGQDDETIRDITVAYDILSDPKARTYYDQHGTLRGYKKSA